MAYIPPLYNVADIEFAADGPYTPLGYNAADIELAGGGGVIFITGRAATASGGTLTPTVTVIPAGIAATASGGTFAPHISVTLTGLQATASSSTLVPSIDGNVSVNVNGLAATASGGALVPTVTVALTGLQATVQQQAIVPTNSPALVGNALTASGGTLGVSVAVTLTGQELTATAGTLLGGSVGDLTTSVATASGGILVPTVTVALTGLQATVQQQALVPVVAVALTTQVATTSSGVLGVTIAVVPAGQLLTISQGTIGRNIRSGTVTWDPNSKGAGTTLSNGDLTATVTTWSSNTNANFGRVISDGGKYYFECVFTGLSGNISLYGLMKKGNSLSQSFTIGTGGATEWGGGIDTSNFERYGNNGTLSLGNSHNYAAGKALQVAVDFTAGKIWFGYDGTWFGSGNPSAGTGAQFSNLTTGADVMLPTLGHWGTANPLTIDGKFKATAFVHTPPTGFNPWEDTDPNANVTMTGLSMTATPGTIYPNAAALVPQLMTISQGAIAPGTGASLTGLSMSAKVGHFQATKANEVVVVYLDGKEATTQTNTLSATVSAGYIGGVVVPAATTSHWTYSGGDDFTPYETSGFAMQNNLVSYDGVLLGVGDSGYKSVSGYFSTERRFGYAVDQTTRGKNWGNASWANSSWNAPGDINEFDAFLSFTGDHYAVGEVYDFALLVAAPGGTFSVDPDGLIHWVHTRGYGLVAGRNNTTPDIVYYLQVADKTQKVFRRNSFTLDGQHEMLMGVYAHTPTRTLVFYPTLSGSDWVPTYRVWDGNALTLSSETALNSFTGNGTCNAQQRHFCVTRAGYGDTIYVSYYSSTGHIGLIVMDALTLSVTSHVLTATVSTGSVFGDLSGSGDVLAANPPPTRSLAEVVYLSNGDSVTQFLLNKQFVRLKWTSSTPTTPTQTLKTGPSSSGLVGGWESLEIKGDSVFHVVYERTLVSFAFNNGTGKYDYVQDFRLYYNDATSTSTSWTYTSSPVWSWTESGTLNQLSYMYAMRWSGYGGGKQSAVYTLPFGATGKGDQTGEAFVSWVDLWATQAPYMSATAAGRVGRVTITIIPGVILAGIAATASPGALTPKIAVTLTGLSATATGGTIIGSIPVDATVGLTGLSMTAAQGSFVIERGINLTGIAAPATGGTFTPTNKPALVSDPLTASSGTLLPTITVALVGLQASAQGGALAVTCGVNLTGQSLTATSGVIVPTLGVRLVGAQLQTGYGIFIPLNSPLLVGAVMAALEGSLQVVMAVPLAGQQASLASGTLGFLYDCNVFPLGVYALGVVSPDPTLTNVPPIGKDDLLWAQAEVEKLFTQVSPDELFNDVEPRE